MCDTATQKVLDGIISKWVSEQKMFTALNVSREAQRNHGVTLRHNEMKNETHRNYADGVMVYDDNGTPAQYDRKLVDLPNIPGQAWAYFPQGVDPDNYDLSALLGGPIDCKDAKKVDPNSVPVPALSTGTQGTAPDPFGLNGTSSSATATAPAAVATPAQKATASTVAGYPVDRRKRLWVPREYIKALGAKSGEWLAVEIDGKSLKIVADASSTKPATRYKVDSKGNIAISKCIFDDAGLTATSYDFLNLNGTVVVKQA